METAIHIHNESEYNEILQQAVAVIETARGNAARAIVSTSNKCIGRLVNCYMSGSSTAHMEMA